MPLAHPQKKLKHQLERDKSKHNQHQKDKLDKLSVITAHVASAAPAPAAFAGSGNDAVSWIRPKSNLEVETSLAYTPTTALYSLNSLNLLQILKDQGLLPKSMHMQPAVLVSEKTKAGLAFCGQFIVVSLFLNPALPFEQHF